MPPHPRPSPLSLPPRGGEHFHGNGRMAEPAACREEGRERELTLLEVGRWIMFSWLAVRDDVVVVLTGGARFAMR